jgi:hypothetical protein
MEIDLGGGSRSHSTSTPTPSSPGRAQAAPEPLARTAARFVRDGLLSSNGSQAASQGYERFEGGPPPAEWLTGRPLPKSPRRAQWQRD